MTDVTDIKGVGPAKAETLAKNGYESVDDIATADEEELAAVDGVGEDRALEFIVEASNLIEEAEPDDTPEDESFDLTPAEVSEEVDDEPEIEVEEVEEEQEAEAEESEEEEEEDPMYTVGVTFGTRMEYDTFHAALMRYHENVYTSHQPAADLMERLLDELYGNESSVSLQLNEYELNTLHTAVKQARTEYQGDNFIDQMEALYEVEEQINDRRRAELF